jgi:hypothetical protein
MSARAIVTGLLSAIVAGAAGLEAPAQAQAAPRR